jgi:hypothetical protein
MVDALGVAGLVVGSMALLEAPYMVRLQRPKLEIEPVTWQPTGPLPSMTFASAQVFNKPLPGPLGFLNRDAAEACEIAIDFFTWGDVASRKRVFDTIKGRWDSHREPLKISRVVSSSSLPGSVVTSPPTGYAGAADPANYGGGTMSASYPGTVPVSGGYSSNTAAWYVEYDPSLDSPQQDISVGSDRGQVSVAILKDGNAFAFANESYNTPLSNHLRKPEWKLTLGETYRIEIHVKGSNADHKQAFKLEYLSNDFTAFKLQEVAGAAVRWPRGRS